MVQGIGSTLSLLNRIGVAAFALLLTASAGLLAAWLAFRGEASRDPGIVLFASRREVLPQEGGGGAGLYAVNSDGTGLRRLTRAGEHLWGGLYFAWFSPSPDGREVAYAGADRWIWVVDIKGRRHRRVTRGEAVVWSPTGDHLAVLRSGSLAVVQHTGRGRHVLARGGVDITPSWSPDGKRLVYVQSLEDDERGALRIAPLRGIQKQLSVIADVYQPPHWSPDGRLIAFGAFRANRPAALTVITPEDTGRRLLARGARLGMQGFLDGSRLAVNDRGVLRWLDVRSGRELAALRMRRGGGPPPELVGLDGDIAAYVAGVALHLVGLPDGPDLIVRTQGIGESLSANLTGDGLAYAYNAGYSRRPGRVVFVPRRELVRALRAGRR